MTVSRNVSSSGARASSQARTAEGTPLDPPGSAITLPNVARAPARAAAWRAASTVAAYGSIGSRRSANLAVPAWSARPRKSSRQRPCGQIALGDADRGAQRGQGPALLDVQLDEGADRAEQVIAGTDPAGVQARGGHRLAPA